MRLDHDVNMIRHHTKGNQSVQLEMPFSEVQRIHHALRYSSLSQPARSRGSVQRAVEMSKGPARFDVG